MSNISRIGVLKNKFRSHLVMPAWRLQGTAILSLLLILMSCSGTGNRPEDPYVPSKIPVDSSAESPESSAVSIPSEEAVQSPSTYPVVLVLGPGLARSFISVGVLKALKKAQIDVGAIIGHEMGGLIGVIYAFSKSTDEFEWSILKLKEDSFKESGLSIGRILKKDNDGKKLKQNLSRLLGSRTLEQSKVKLTLVIQEKGKEEPLYVENGSAVEWIWKGFGQEGFFQETLENGKVFKSATEIMPFAVNYAKEMAMGPVIVVDATTTQAVESGEKDKELKMHQLIFDAVNRSGDGLEQADLVLRPSLLDMGYFEFEKKTNAIYEGEQLVNQRLIEIKKLCGKDSN